MFYPGFTKGIGYRPVARFFPSLGLGPGLPNKIPSTSPCSHLLLTLNFGRGVIFHPLGILGSTHIAPGSSHDVGFHGSWVLARCLPPFRGSVHWPVPLLEILPRLRRGCLFPPGGFFFFLLSASPSGTGPKGGVARFTKRPFSRAVVGALNSALVEHPRGRPV